MRTMHLRPCVIVIAVCTLGTARVLAAADAGAPTTSAAEAMERLMAGNERFQNDRTGHPLLHCCRPTQMLRSDLVTTVHRSPPVVRSGLHYQTVIVA
jgi:hypothetical protein